MWTWMEAVPRQWPRQTQKIKLNKLTVAIGL
jgi:hypothetical protein